MNREQRMAFERLQRSKKEKLRGKGIRLNGEKPPEPTPPEEKLYKEHKFGKILACIQAVVSVVFVGMMSFTGVFPKEYIIWAAVILGILFLIVFSTQRNRKKRAVGGKLLSLLLIVVISFGTFYSGKLYGAFDKITKETDKNQIPDVNVKKESFTVYISGIDVYGEITKESRSDVNIIATVNPETHQILLVTTPRDYFIEIPGVSEGKRDKLTHAGNYGADASMRALGQLYGTEIPFYARVNFTSLIEIVDHLGGVDVNSEYAFTTGTESGKVINVSEGMNHFYGEEALAFARERHNVPGGDNQRGKNQQAIITGMIKKMLSPQMLVKASGIIDSVSGNMETNMSQKQMKTLIKDQLREKEGWNILSVAAEGQGGRDYCYSAPNSLLYVTYPDEESVANIQNLITRVKNGEILEGSEIAE